MHIKNYPNPLSGKRKRKAERAEFLSEQSELRNSGEGCTLKIKYGDVLDLTGCSVEIGCESERCSPSSTSKLN